MPDFSSLTLFCVAAFALIITPGPEPLYVIGRSVGQGRAVIASALESVLVRW